MDPVDGTLTPELVTVVLPAVSPEFAIEVFPIVNVPADVRSTSFTSDTVSVPLEEATVMFPAAAVSVDAAPPLIVTVFAFFTIEVPVSPAKEILELISCATFTASVSNLPAATFVI